MPVSLCARPISDRAIDHLLRHPEHLEYAIFGAGAGRSVSDEEAAVLNQGDEERCHHEIGYLGSGAPEFFQLLHEKGEFPLGHLGGGEEIVPDFGEPFGSAIRSSLVAEVRGALDALDEDELRRRFCSQELLDRITYYEVDDGPDEEDVANFLTDVRRTRGIVADAAREQLGLLVYCT
jgi:hypothetical protein